MGGYNISKNKKEGYSYSENMNDPKWKARFLQSLIKNHLPIPDDKVPSPSLSNLSYVLSQIKTNDLLHESSEGPVDQNQQQIDEWKSAVDAWVERLLQLVSSNMPEKCWAGTCLLGLTCEGCNTERFLALYDNWFEKLISQIQPPSDSHFVNVATCASLSDMLTRLGGIPSVKKDGTSHAGKLIQPALKLLTEDSSEAVWEWAVVLLSNILTFFPYAVHRHYDSVEAVIASKIMSGKCSENISKKLSHCLALLPRSRGDADCWSLMMEKALILINIHLNHAFQGLEEETKCSEAMKYLVPPGKEPPPPLGGQTMLVEASDEAIIKSEKLIIPRVSTLLLCCCAMLTNLYPVQVTVPVRPLLALVNRVLSVDGSLSKALLSFVTVKQQDFICSELPALHSYSLDLLIAIIKGVRSQLLPHAADVVRLLTEYLRQCSLPSLRIKVYSVVQLLLTSMGVGMSLYLAQEIVNNAIIDLDSVNHEHGSVPSGLSSEGTMEAVQQARHRKRKRISTTGTLKLHQNGVVPENEVHENKPKVPISVQIASLQTLEVLLTVGGALRSEFWRANVDNLLITVATNACDRGWTNQGTFDLSHGPVSTWADFQLAALRALLASLVSPAHGRPPYLSEGLELFRRGKQETGTKLAEFCAHALLALEVLIHPRALPLGDYTSGSHKAFNDNWRLDEPDPEDDLYNRWHGRQEETEAPVSVRDMQLENAEEAHEKRQANENSRAEKISSEHSAGGQAVAVDIRGDADVEMGTSGDGIMVQTEQPLESVSHLHVETSDKSPLLPTSGAVVDASTDATVSTNISVANEMTSTPAASASLLGQNNLPSSPSVAQKGKDQVLDFNSDSSMDGFPDIIVGDPDSD